MPTHEDDLPGYIHDAYAGALAHGLQRLNLTRVGGGENRMWQCSSQFPRSGGYHVHIEADPFDAIISALNAWTRIEGATPAAPPAPQPEAAPGGLFD